MCVFRLIVSPHCVPCCPRPLVSPCRSWACCLLDLFTRTRSYRLRSRCATCPSTAWLLFLAFSFAIVAGVAAAVYLSKKRINMAGLSIGVVCVCVARSAE
jgi:hypothetical protein